MADLLANNQSNLPNNFEFHEDFFLLKRYLFSYSQLVSIGAFDFCLHYLGQEDK